MPARRRGLPFGRSEYSHYLEVLDLVVAFEALVLRPEQNKLRACFGLPQKLAWVSWVMSTTTSTGWPPGWGALDLRAASMLLLILPGAAFIYQGDEICPRERTPAAVRRTTVRGAPPPREPCGHPMHWDASPTAVFTAGEPWLSDGPIPGATSSLGTIRGSLLQALPPADLGPRLFEMVSRLLVGLATASVASTAESSVVRSRSKPPCRQTRARLRVSRIWTTHPDPLAEGWLAPHAGVSISRNRVKPRTDE